MRKWVCAPVAARVVTGALALSLAGVAPARAQDDAPARGSASAQSPAVKAGFDAWQNRDYATAVRDWQGPAQAGDPDAQFDLGQAYKLGRGVPQDLTRAEALFGQAAARGHVQASDTYGLLLFQRGAHAEAMPYVQKAAARGDPRAEYLLGIAHFNADVVPKDWVRAYAYETMAEQAGLPQAKSALAQMDNYIPIEQRQQGVAMAADLTAQSEATRQREIAAADLGASPAGGSTAVTVARHPPLAVASPAPHHPPRTPAPVAMADPAPAPKPVHHAPPAVASGSGTWKIQLGAFGVAANAEAQWRRAAATGAVAGHARQLLPAGKVNRLMATGFSEAGAHATCARLSAAGVTCVPVRD